MPVRRPARSRAALLVASVLVLGLAVPTAVPTAGASPTGRAGATRPTTLAGGVTTWRDTFRNARGRTVQAVLVQARLGRHVTLQARTPGQLIGLNRVRLSTLARRAGAVAGVNADFFDFTTDAAVPLGAVINGGQVLKTPRPGRLANLYLRADGRAAIGAIAFTGSVTRAASTGRRAVTHRIYSVNSLDDALNEHLILVNRDDVGGYLDTGCEVALAHTVNGVSTILSVVRSHVMNRPPAGTWALAGCLRSADWLRANLRAGDRVGVSLQYPQGKPVVAVSGRRQLVRNGLAYDDPTSSPLSTWGPNPETFACVSKDGLTVLLGAIDGRIKDSAGVTYDQLTAYLLRLHCWSAVVFDGGGSTELVAKLPGHRTVTVQNHPADGSERAIPDALVVVTR